jgi:hypothetical protein
MSSYEGDFTIHVVRAWLPAREIVLPDTPYALWVDGALDGLLHLPETSRVEIIGGEIVVSPAPQFRHGMLIDRIGLPLSIARHSGFSWYCARNVALELCGLLDGYVPDLLVLDARTAQEADDADVRNLTADQIEMAVEVTSSSSAVNDRRPASDDAKPTKWSGYALAKIPYYLLVDADPKDARVTLYSIADPGTGTYLQEETWQFGETIVLPEHLGVMIPTTNWEPWSDQS